MSTGGQPFAVSANGWSGVMSPTAQERSDCQMVISPGSMKYWIPACEDVAKPFVGQCFPDVGAAVDFYAHYAVAVGFDLRQSTVKKTRSGQIIKKYLLCSREGFKASTVRDDASSSSQRRRRVSNRVGCKAKLVLKVGVSGSVVIDSFEERHNHCLCSVVGRPFLKVNRKLDFGHQKFVADCARANIGPVRSYRLFKEMVGGYSNIGATSVDFKNFKRDLLAYISGADSQLVIENFFKKRDVCSAFFFEYDVDEIAQLTRIFWCDPISRQNFTTFGDVVSFDATYRTNWYNLVFVPFTGVDNHKRCVTFAAGLLTREDVQSYVWLLERFKMAMSHEPLCTVTDQDPAMKVAVSQVFPTTCHRFCMWHIMMKVGEKVGPRLNKDEVFRKKLCDLVWTDSLDPVSFEGAWWELIDAYGLRENSWFRQMFELRSHWIPAFFRDLFMGGLVRTTSRSEGEKFFFSSFTNPHSSLVEFMMHFESALDAQRHTNAKLNSDCDGYIPDFKTPLEIERHAATVYTIQIFYAIQGEICSACFSCRVLGIKESGGVVMYEIVDGRGIQVAVEHSLRDETISCTCKLFERMGFLCRHIFLVYKDLQLKCIPLRYVVPRWCRVSSLRPIFHIDGDVVDQCPRVAGKKTMVNQLWSDFYACVGLVDNNMDWLHQFSKLLREQKEFYQKGQGGTKQGTGKQVIIQTFCGPPPNADLVVREPPIAKNKGSGKRLKGSMEKAQELHSKPKRRTCNALGHHDSRNCPMGS